MSTLVYSFDTRSRVAVILDGKSGCTHNEAEAHHLPLPRVHIQWPQSVTIGGGEDETESAHDTVIGELVDTLTDSAVKADTHFEMLDSTVASLFCLHFKTSNRSSEDVQIIINNAMNLLDQLPSLPPACDLGYPLWHGPGLRRLQSYFTPEAKRGVLKERHLSSPWEELEVVSKSATTVLKMAVIIVSCGMARFDVAATMSKFVDLVSELVDGIEERSKLTGASTTLLERDIVQAFLWSTWTRCLQLFFWFILRHHLAFGADITWNRLIALRGMTALMNPSIRATLYGWANVRVPYMCSWAFQVLKSDRCSLALDFRHFHQRYAELHGAKRARCLWKSSDACDGGHPLGCGRFQDKRLVAEEQSVHECANKDCRRIRWSRENYVNVTGAVAVGLSTAGELVQYMEATEKTMAISHVWSHGHGGRPDTGMNACLHERFSGLARQHDCDSYWIDTLCIPNEHMLRKKAIGCINRIFAQSNVVLVLDRDLMEIDVCNPTTALLESILATFLVCDWNVRAWTMLEAMKGCHNLRILCRDNVTLSLRDTLTHVHQSGSIDLAILSLATQHLLPSSTDPFRRASSRKGLEFSGSLLSHRHATRKGDDIVIWSLISGINVFFDATSFWRGRIGRKIRTGFLMSSAPRLEHITGFSWAPETPYIRRIGDGSTADLLGPFLVYDAEESEEAEITSRGLDGPWLVYHLRSEDAPRYAQAASTMVSITQEGERVVQPLDGPGIRNRCWERAAKLLLDGSYVALLAPLQWGKQTAYRAKENRGEAHGPVFAMCTSREKTYWTWRGVSEWPVTISRPEMEVEDLILV